ncbi:hypothetical protein HALO113_80991 [Halomonas sp. 113]|nr:hypothetical protein HALO156_130093 [Halomonas sp. 156]CAD5291211.1 hypothetical protein HALO113_80991 [Halomonas sp. 113]CAD5296180.1 hypothetical protein HALOI3_70301 [Halomonas sp. I3]VXB57823.1 hypothetical protein HALO153_170011 [Halomonas titanicae]
MSMTLRLYINTALLLHVTVEFTVSSQRPLMLKGLVRSFPRRLHFAVTTPGVTDYVALPLTLLAPYPVESYRHLIVF